MNIDFKCNIRKSLSSKNWEINQFANVKKNTKLATLTTFNIVKIY